jgi:UDP-N-acetylmuramate--alanine ligase
MQNTHIQLTTTNDIHQPRNAHFVGIGGTGMRALAAVLLERGWTISGSDLELHSARPLIARGVRVREGRSGGNIPSKSDLLVYSEAIQPDNAERRQAEQAGISTVSYAQLLAAATSQYQTVAIAGTHGKSTTTAMIAEVLILGSLDPTVVCGAIPQIPTSEGIGDTGGRHGTGEFAIVEACEYRENFLHLRPQVATILNIEPDHFDFYRTREQLVEAFTKFLDRLPKDGLVIASHDDTTARGIASTSGRQMVTFGLSRNADWRATNLQQSRGRYRFEIVRHGKRLTGVTLAVPGRHNVLNALAAAAIARHCGVSVQHIAQGLAAFRGLKQRLEPRGSWGGVPWIDDYAHHPTEIKASLAALRQMYPRRRIVCVFQPHQASRLTILLDELAASLHNADCVAVASVFRAREGAPQPGEATAADLAAKLRADGVDVLEPNQPAAIGRRLSHQLQPGDLLVTLGAGDLGKIFHDIRERIRRNCAVA